MSNLSQLLQQAHGLINAGQLDQADMLFRQIIQQFPNQAEVYSDWGIVLHGMGRLREAEQAFRQALQKNPNLANVNSNLGVCLQDLGQVESAVQFHRRSIELDPNFAAGHLNLGNSLSALGRHKEALVEHQRAVELNPRVANGCTNLGNTLMELGRTEEALKHHQKAIELEPRSATAHLNLGNTLHVLGRYAEAEAMHRKSAELNPKLAAAYSNWGNTLYELNRLQDAVKACQKAIELEPNFRNAHMNLGNIYRKLGRLEEAENHHRLAVKLDPKFADGQLNFGNTLYALGRFEQALEVFAETERLKPGYPSARSNAGMAYVQLERFDEALASFSDAIRVDGNFPDAHWNLGFTQLMLGRWEEGWKEYEWRFRLKQWDKKFSDKPRWEGQPLEGKTIVLMAEQGVGDNLMTFRFVPMVKALGARVILQAKPKLHALFATIGCLDGFIPEGTNWPEHDYLAPIMSLPGRFNARADSIPGQVPYLHPPEQLTEYWRKRLDDISGVRIGIAWQGSPTFTSDRWRSLPLKAMAALAKVPGVKLISLQQGPGAEQIAQLQGLFPVIELGNDVDKDRGAFMDTAAIMKNLDLVIASDTSIPHLAGAIDVPVWLACGKVADWRWLRDCDDSPWYPSMRIFRQTDRERWDNVFEMMAEALPEFLGKRGLKSGQNLTSLKANMLAHQGNTLHQAGRFAEALAHFDQALEVDPDHADASINRGVALQSLGRLEEAAEAYEAARKKQPDSTFALRNLGVCYKELGRFDESLQALDALLKQEPNHPEAHWVRSFDLLAQGHWEEGWKESAWRSKLPGRTPFQTDRPLWQGEPLDGKTLLVHCEQGLGDMLMFLRFVPLLKERKARVILRGPVELKPLLAKLSCIDLYLPDQDAIPAHDYQAMLPDLPAAFSCTPETIPAPIHLKVDPDIADYWRGRMDALAGFKIGIAWQGSPNYVGDQYRSIPLAAFKPLADTPGVKLISLQRQHGLDQLSGIDFPVLNLGAHVDGDHGRFVDTAAIMNELDLIIASDSAIAHLAGTLRRPTWIALPVVAEWRWLTVRTDTPWYPSARLFRQTKRGEWLPLFEKIAGELRSLVKSAKPRPLMVEAAPGELIDKITILEIKSERITQPEKLKNVRHELAVLSATRDAKLADSPELRKLTQELKSANLALWEIEDEIRLCEKAKDFSKKFVELARSVYKTNDRRAEVKRAINELFQSAIVEEKSYAKYD